MIPALLAVVAALTTPMPGGGTVSPNEDGITGFDPVWDEREFDLAGYMNGLDPDATLWYQHVQTLSNPWFGGRQPGTRGDELTAEYIQWYLSDAGLLPAFPGDDGGAWRQGFEFQLSGQTPTIREAALAVGNTQFTHGTDFQVLAPSGPADTRLPLSIAGYSIERGPNGFSSFAEDDDLSGRAVLLLRYEPLTDEGSSQWTPSGYSPRANMRDKLAALADRNAAAILLVNPPSSDAADLETPQSSVGFGQTLDVPVLHLSQATAEALLQTASGGSLDLKAVEATANQGGGVTHLPSWRKARVTVDLEPPNYPTWNVGGILPGAGDLADEWVVIGGHYDHLGHGYTGSRSPGDSRVHPGADDNASGTAAMLILADRLAEAAETDGRDRRSALFVGFSGEEAGLHGSTAFVADPPIDLDRTNLMLNLDMMGRLRGGTVALNGTGTAEEFTEMLPRLVEPSGLTVLTTSSGLGPSDHSNFFKADVPVLFFFTGLHDDYHTPEDVAWRVNPEGTLRIIDLCEVILDEAMHRDAMFTFRESTAGTPARNTGAKIRLGVMPSYTTADEPGVLIDGVSEGTSAADAGLAAGDIIIGWDDATIDGGRDLMDKLRSHAPGDTITITLIRDGEKLKLPVTLKAR
ncbi:MAG: M28 family peptidase [Phycisphaerales bacterium]|jgi:hypothetical protein|nr:M28 family peptidase [Phycisphaerales bacterium]